jgi:hypothetical protein
MIETSKTHPFWLLGITSYLLEKSHHNIAFMLHATSKEEHVQHRKSTSATSETNACNMQTKSRQKKNYDTWKNNGAHEREGKIVEARQLLRLGTSLVYHRCKAPATALACCCLHRAHHHTKAPRPPSSVAHTGVLPPHWSSAAAHEYCCPWGLATASEIPQPSGTSVSIAVKYLF